MERTLSQAEIDSVFRNLREPDKGEGAPVAVAYDFRRPDRIAKDQLRAIHQLHDNFARNLASSLSAYLRAYVMVNLVSVEQLSFAEFSQCLPSPTCVVSLSLRPLEGAAVMEINPSLVFPILEMLLGGSGKAAVRMTREITEIEQTILDALFRIVLHDLREAWRGVSPIDFSIEARETEPQLLQILAPNEAVVSISAEVRIGDHSGMINLGIPSIIIKMLRQKFEQQWSVRKSISNAEEQARMLRLLCPAQIALDARLLGPSILVEDFLNLDVGDVLTLDFGIDRPLKLLANGCIKYGGHIVASGNRKSFAIEDLERPD